MNSLPEDYFLDADDELVAFLEKQGEEVIREIQTSNKINVENGYKLLSIQIVGIGSSFLLLTQKTNFDFLTAGIATFTVLWTWCAIYLVHSGLSVKMRGLIYAPPQNLYTQNYKDIEGMSYQMFFDAGYKGEENPLPLIRRYRLANLNDTANELLLENKKIRNCLDKARMFTILAPVVAMLISAVFLSIL
ncbi:TPA: hypothetical protein MJE22_000721 [Klebsiella pneumoniae]|uniref:Uncharacterized protein n=1 Tax=Klebsiella variicola TaxID=244366 RepID=A0A9P0VCF6_KLEVA|nr:MULTISPECIES: hypothetical protein [Klebsiella]HBY9604183.1 hypothetical protein [Klebsiella pneumoniae]HDU4693645.1 hypothetical protein [Klebsiella pneumoniae subsp. pneumoniae]CAH6260557.1 hypothetical protein AN2335V1_4979 [Klebsiella variicola]HBY9962039.1 hypothetical protein [Klebsiella pneumoniae]HBY9973651.1 hypothetical protein [Klebsiella pneumoniae]